MEGSEVHRDPDKKNDPVRMSLSWSAAVAVGEGGPGDWAQRTDELTNMDPDGEDGGGS